ncbi:hypothetical protein Y032_0156g3114 [Ancylostoma ceylanicum]|uniref:Uncharacterized protein n=1 Tax=Ancylostoma ceylanicum TaxID=53326 RepID=A0A016SZ57_9BILA|nr:hypothetical protein Y032_0156g3114 [Ancylostoma ceylanicum]
MRHTCAQFSWRLAAIRVFDLTHNDYRSAERGEDLHGELRASPGTRQRSLWKGFYGAKNRRQRPWANIRDEGAQKDEGSLEAQNVGTHIS